MANTLEPSAIWEYAREAKRRYDRGIVFCNTLESGTLCLSYLSQLQKDVEPGPADLLYALGRASGCTIDPAQNNLHANLNNVLLCMWLEFRSVLMLAGDDTPIDALKNLLTPDELKEIAREFGPQLRAITQADLKAEAEATCLMLEGENPRIVKPTLTERVKGHRKQSDVSRDAEAMAVSASHPDWTKADIARHLKITPQALAPKKCPNLSKMLKLHKGELPKGSKQDGQTETSY